MSIKSWSIWCTQTGNLIAYSEDIHELRDTLWRWWGDGGFPDDDYSINVRYGDDHRVFLDVRDLLLFMNEMTQKFPGGYEL